MLTWYLLPLLAPLSLLEVVLGKLLPCGHESVIAVDPRRLSPPIPSVAPPPFLHLEEHQKQKG